MLRRFASALKKFRSHQRQPRRSRRLEVQQLESRAMMAVVASLVDGNLVIQGDDDANHVSVSRFPSRFPIGGGWHLVTPTYIVRDGGNEIFRHTGAIGQVEFHGAGGDDRLDTSFPEQVVGAGLTPRTRPSILVLGPIPNVIAHGGEGNDCLHGSGASDQLFGGPGNDVLIGRGGNDELHGGEGDDMLFGEDGWDQLWGGDGNDFLDGGRDNHSDLLNGGAGNDAFAPIYTMTVMQRVRGFRGGGWTWELRPVQRQMDVPRDFDSTKDSFGTAVASCNATRQDVMPVGPTRHASTAPSQFMVDPITRVGLSQVVEANPGDTIAKQATNDRSAIRLPETVTPLAHNQRESRHSTVPALPALSAAQAITVANRTSTSSLPIDGLPVPLSDGANDGVGLDR
jgi:hypothetical protein